MPLAMTVTDATDGTGGSATITGSSGTNQVYYSPWTGVMTSRTWTLGGTRSGDGTVPLTIGVGYFEFQLVSAGTLGPIVYKNFTNAATIDAFHYQYLLGVQNRVNQLSMAGLDASRQKVAWLPRATDVDLPSLPLLWISPAGFEVNVSTVLNEDDFLYPIICAIMVKQNNDSVANLQAVLKWREQILRAISYQRIAGITPSMWAEAKPMQVIDPTSFSNAGILLSVLGFGFRTRMTRGLT